MKTVRFSQVVKRCGKPQVHALWVAPEKDPVFKNALAASRIMTVRPAEAGKADAGQIGYDPSSSRGGQFLIFPKSLQPFKGARVVGVKFDLVDQPTLLPAKAREAWAPPRKAGARKPVSETSADTVVRAVETPTSTPRRIKEPAGVRPDSHVTSARPGRRAPPRRQRSQAERKGESISLLREVRAALRELKAGKAVAAYQRLERAAQTRTA